MVLNNNDSLIVLSQHWFELKNKTYAIYIRRKSFKFNVQTRKYKNSIYTNLIKYIYNLRQKGIYSNMDFEICDEYLAHL